MVEISLGSNQYSPEDQSKRRTMKWKWLEAITNKITQTDKNQHLGRWQPNVPMVADETSAQIYDIN